MNKDRKRERERLFQIRTNKKRTVGQETERQEQPDEEEEEKEVSIGWTKGWQVGFNYSENNTCLASHCSPGRVFLVRDPEHRVSLRRHTFRSPRDLHVIDNPFFQLCSSIDFGVNGCELLGMNRVHKVSKVSISSIDSWSSNRPHDFLLI